jgi:hypothetical protein
MKFFMFLLFFVIVVKAQAQTNTNASTNFNPIIISGSAFGGSTNLPSPTIPIGGGTSPNPILTSETQDQDVVPEPTTLMMILLGIVIILILAPVNRKI